MKPNNHYERAFEAYMRELRVLSLATQERCRALATEKDFASLKTPDFLLSTEGRSWLVDVKGRKFPSGIRKPQYWRNWIFKDDLVSLRRWENYFGAGFTGLFVFVYDIVRDQAPVPQERLFSFQGHLYAFIAVPTGTYHLYQRDLSAAWQTITMPVELFRRHARPLDEILCPVQPRME